MKISAEARPHVAGAAVVMAWPLLFNGFYKEQLFDLGELFFWLSDYVQSIVLPALCLIYIYLRVNIKPADYGLALPRDSDEWWRLISATAGTTLILYVAYNVVSRLAWSISAAPPPEFTYHTAMPEGIMRVLVALYFALTAGVTEEIAFRGLPWAVLKTLRWNGWLTSAVYVMLTSTLFAAIHWENGSPEILATFCFGVAAGCIYLRLQTLWPLISAHVLLDIIVFW